MQKRTSQQINAEWRQQAMFLGEQHHRLEMANKMIAVLKRPPLQKTLSRNGFHEANKFNWGDSAMKVKKIYEEVIAKAQSEEK